MGGGLEGSHELIEEAQGPGAGVQLYSYLTDTGRVRAWKLGILRRDRKQEMRIETRSFYSYFGCVFPSGVVCIKQYEGQVVQLV